MAIILDPISVEAQVIERTKFFSVDTPYGDNPKIQVLREKVMISDGAVISRVNIAAVTRFANQVGAGVVTLHDGTKVTEAQIMEALPMIFDQWAKEDASRPPEEI